MKTRIVNNDGKKSVHIIIDEKKNIKCKINLNIKEIDWRIFQNSLRTELSTKLNIEEDKLLEREFIKLKFSIRKLEFKSKVEYKKYALENKLEESPEIKYEKWWINYYDFLTIDISKYPNSKKELIKKCKLHAIKADNYYNYIDKYELPTMPEELYSDFGILNNELNNNLESRRK